MASISSEVSVSCATASRTAWSNAPREVPPSLMPNAFSECPVHKHRNLLAHATERLHDEITTDYTDMIYAATPEE